MKSLLVIFLSIVLIVLIPVLLFGQTTIEQQLVVVNNEQVVDGDFQIEVQVKGTNLPAANTLGSATIDVSFDNTKLTYVDATGWTILWDDGYDASATNNTTFIRILITSGGVNGTTRTGHDITSSYESWVQLNFTIADASGTTSLSILPGSNAIGLFENHGNNPATYVINNQTLSSPVNINDVSLPVTLNAFYTNVVDGKVILKWSTQSEIENVGFEVWRSLEEAGNYVLYADYHSNPELEGLGNSPSGKDYEFVDDQVAPGQTYWYKIADVDFNGQKTFHGPVSATLGVTDIDLSSIGTNLPTQFKLFPNFPNPFNPSTTIRFDIPSVQSGPLATKIEVYNCLGQVINTLYEGELTAGSFQATWDSTTRDGQIAPAGIYFAILTSGDYRQAIKMLLTK